MTRVRIAALALALGFLASCAPRPRTEVMVRVFADTAVAAEARRLAVRVFEGPEATGEPFSDDVGTELTPLTYPVRIALVPREGDASRTYRVEVDALDVAGGVLARTRVVSGFVPQRTLQLDLRLESCCRDVTCGDDQACRACACAPIEVDPGSLEPLEPDGPPDASIGPIDAPLPDVFVPQDANGCGENCFLVDGRTGDLNIAPPLEDRRWARPLGGCPASALSSSDQHGVRGIYVHNPTETARAVRFESLRAPPMDPSVDLALVVYDVPSVQTGTPLPADPLACRAMNEDDPTLAPDARLDVTIAPRATLLVLVTRETADQIVSPNVNIGVRTP